MSTEEMYSMSTDDGKSCKILDRHMIISTSCFFVICRFFLKKITFSKNSFKSVKQFGSSSGPTFC